MTFEYSDSRKQEVENETLILENGKIASFNKSSNKGIGVRVFYKNSWGLASSTNPKEKSKCYEKALNLAKFRANFSNKSREIYAGKATGFEKTNYKINPFEIEASEKINILKKIEKELKKESFVKSTQVFLSASRNKIFFENSQSSEIEQDFTSTSIGFFVTGRQGNVIQFDFNRHSKREGFEIVNDFDIEARCKTSLEKLKRLLKAGHAKPGKYPVVLDGGMTGLFFHEAVGHACEADEHMKKTSFINAKIGTKIASECINVSDPGFFENSSSSYIYDDEGIKGTNTKLIKNGAVVGRLHSIDTASFFNEKPNGHGRAMGFSFFPIPRMTNIMLKSGNFTVEELFEGIKKGYYVKDWRAGEVDPETGHFVYSCTEAFEIINGKLGNPVRDVVLSGDAMKTLKLINGVSKKINRSFSGGYCGKDDQNALPSNHFAPHIRVKEAIVGGRD